MATVYFGQLLTPAVRVRGYVHLPQPQTGINPDSPLYPRQQGCYN